MLLFYRYIVCLFVCLQGIPSKAQDLDERVLRALHENRNQQLDPAMKGISSSTYIVCIGLPVITGIKALSTKDTTLWQKSVVMTTALGISAASTLLMKRLVNRNRPASEFAWIEPLTPERCYSFPSGHTANAFCTATTLSMNFRKWYIVAPAYTWATLVSYSRIHHGMHYPGDVVAGAVLGAVSAWGVYKINALWRIKNQPKKTLSTP